ncbi:MAG: DUF4282 domain-containing protein [Neisseriaceae bacterium]|nr:MAG: DUF4282 domain-containing protein [Neisseriaceae bacterium]
MLNKQGNDFQLRNFFSFNKFITPSVITFMFNIGVLVIILMGISMIYEDLMRSDGFFGVLSSLWGGTWRLVLSLLFVRIATEFVMVVFDIRQNLREINNKTNYNKTN